MHPKPQIVSIETRTVVRILFLIAAFMVGLATFHLIARELVWIGVAFFLAVSLDPAVHATSRHLKVGRVWATSIVFGVFLAFVGFLAATLVPPLVTQTETLVKELPGYLHNQAIADTNSGRLLQRYKVVDYVENAQDDIIAHITTGPGTALGILINIFSGITAVITILVFSFFMLLEGPRWLHLATRYVPRSEKPHLHRIAERMYGIVAGYTNGNLLIAGGVGIITAAILTVFGVPYAIPLGILSGFLTLLPVIGAVIAIVVVGGVAFFTSTPAALAVIGFLTFYTLIDGHIIRPLVFGKTIQMSPLAVMVSILIGTGLGGLIGALVAIPVAACLGVVIEELIAYERAKGKPKGRGRIA